MATHLTHLTGQNRCSTPMSRVSQDQPPMWVQLRRGSASRPAPAAATNATGTSPPKATTPTVQQTTTRSCSEHDQHDRAHPERLAACDACCNYGEKARREYGHPTEGCPILRLAAQGVRPPQWRRFRGEWRCTDFLARPPVSQPRKTRSTAVDEPPMFDAEQQDRTLVAVDGWPDYRAESRRAKDGNHAS